MTSLTPSRTGREDTRAVVPDPGAPTFHRGAIEAIVAAASRAPSLHNTQPWSWRLADDVLDVRADRTRQLRVADPDGHSLLISCGAAVELTAVALAAGGNNVSTDLMPDPADPDLLARFRLISHTQPDWADEQRMTAARRRRSDRRVFGPEPVAPEVIERLREAAQAPAVYADFPVRPDETLNLAVAISRADGYERDYPAYAAEMAQWVRRDPTADDGVPTTAIAAVRDDQPRHTDIPLRDFEPGITGAEQISTGSDERPLIAVIFTEADSPRERLRAGRSMMRLMIAAELDGIASCPLSQSVDLLFFRSHLKNSMSWIGYPQMLLRLGQRPDAPIPPLTTRRPVHDVLTISTVRVRRPLTAPGEGLPRCASELPGGGLR